MQHSGSLIKTSYKRMGGNKYKNGTLVQYRTNTRGTRTPGALMDPIAKGDRYIVKAKIITLLLIKDIQRPQSAATTNIPAEIIVAKMISRTYFA